MFSCLFGIQSVDTSPYRGFVFFIHNHILPPLLFGYIIFTTYGTRLSVSLFYSQKLIDDTIQCFKEENGIDLSHDQAVECLHNMAGLFLAFAKDRKVGVTSSASRKKADSVTPLLPLNDLLTNKLNKKSIYLNQNIRRKNEFGVFVLA